MFLIKQPLNIENRNMYSKKYLLNDRGKSNRSSKFQIFYLTWRGRNSSFSINSNLVTMKNGFAADKFSMSCSGQAFTRTSCPTICESVSINVGLNSPPLPSHSPSHNSPVLYNHPTFCWEDGYQIIVGVQTVHNLRHVYSYDWGAYYGQWAIWLFCAFNASDY